jgi:hypothetical protein
VPRSRGPELDPPAVRIGWLKMLLRRLRRDDRDGRYGALIAETERLIAAAERERAPRDERSAG